MTGTQPAQWSIEQFVESTIPQSLREAAERGDQAMASRLSEYRRTVKNIVIDEMLGILPKNSKFWSMLQAG
jgi:hypothetical protein